jgi:hypothetical protein
MAQIVIDGMKHLYNSTLEHGGNQPFISDLRLLQIDLKQFWILFFSIFES